MSEDGKKPPMDVVTAFLVIVPSDGPCYATVDVPDGLRPSREATLVDIRRAALEISADLSAQAAAQYVQRFAAMETTSNSQRVAEALAERQSAVKEETTSVR